MLDISLISWNIRGVNNHVSKRNLQKLIRESKASFLFLQETKCKSWSNEVTYQIWNSHNYYWLVVNLAGASGGLVLSLSKTKGCMQFIDSRNNWLLCKGSIEQVCNVNLINIYGPHLLEEKSEFWDGLSSAMKKMQ